MSLVLRGHAHDAEPSGHRRNEAALVELTAIVRQKELVPVLAAVARGDDQRDIPYGTVEVDDVAHDIGRPALEIDLAGVGRWLERLCRRQRVFGCACGERTTTGRGVYRDQLVNLG